MLHWEVCKVVHHDLMFYIKVNIIEDDMILLKLKSINA